MILWSQVNLGYTTVYRSFVKIMATLEERVSRLEGGYDHLATKADLSDLKSEIKSELMQIESRLLRWMIAMVLTSIIVASSVATLIQGFVD